VLGTAAGLLACGGGSDKADVNPTALLDSAFSHPIPTSQTGVNFSLETQGVPQLEAGPVELNLDGPYISGKGKEIPSVDWNLDVTLGGLGVNGRVVSTGDNAYVQFLGSTYEVGAAPVAKVNQGIVAATQEAGGHPQPLANLGIHPRSWFEGGEYVGDEEIGGVNTRHITADLDAAAVVGDLHGLANELGIKDSSLEVWIGVDDEIVRQLSLSAAFEIPPSQRDTVGGLTGGDFSLDILQTDVGENQNVSAPPGPYKPISELLKQLPPIPGLSGVTGGT
jgi:hypothetical protein